MFEKEKPKDRKMSILGKAYRRVIKALTQDDVLDILSGKKNREATVFPEYSDEEKLSIIQRNALVYACITQLARGFQQPPLVIEKLMEGEWVVQKESFYLIPFKENPYLTENDILQYAMLHLNPTGKAFLWKWKSDDGVVRELWPIPPNWVTINPAEELGDAGRGSRVIKSFTINAPGAQKQDEWVLYPDEVVYTRFPHPTRLWDGMSPLEAAAQNIFLDNSGTEYRAESITSMTTPSVIVKTRKDMNRKQKDALKSALKRKSKSGDIGSYFIISGDEASVDYLNPMKDVDWLATNDIDETRICMVFGVPPIVVGALVGLKNSPWSNTEEAKKWMYSNTLVALWELVAASYSAAMIPIEERATLRYAFDLTDVKELQEEVEKVIERIGRLWDSGLMMRNESREALNMQPVPGVDVFKYQMNTVLVPAEETASLGTGVEEIPLDEQLETEDDL